MVCLAPVVMRSRDGPCLTCAPPASLLHNMMSDARGGSGTIYWYSCRQGIFRGRFVSLFDALSPIHSSLDEPSQG